MGHASTKLELAGAAFEVEALDCPPTLARPATPPVVRRRRADRAAVTTPRTPSKKRAETDEEWFERTFDRDPFAMYSPTKRRKFRRSASRGPARR